MSMFTLVTGASTGIGRMLASDCAMRGEHLVLVARSEDKLLSLAAELHQSFGVTVHVCCQDISDSFAAGRIVEFCEQRGVLVDRLINCAGFSVTGNFESMDEEALVQMAMVNMVAVALLTRKLLPAMLARRRGAVINIASLAGFQGVPGMACYSATKSFVIGLTEALFVELRGTGVRVFAVCPGFIDNDSFYERAGHDRRRIVVPVSAPEVVVRAVRRGISGRSVLVLPTGFDWLMVFTQRFVTRRVAVTLAGLFAGAADRH